jgi:hypothetical protein
LNIVHRRRFPVFIDIEEHLRMNGSIQSENIASSKCEGHDSG